MTTKYHQISFNDIFSDCQNKLIDDSPSFFSMLSEHVDLNEFIRKYVIIRICQQLYFSDTLFS